MTAPAAALTAVLVAGTGVLAGCGSGGSATPDGAKKHTAAPVWNRSPESVAAVGDSITRGFDACAVLADCPEVSWATGTDPAVRSLAERLLGPTAAKKNSWNHATTGATMTDLPDQMELAAREKPELVTVMAGANDACRDTTGHMTSVADFRASFETAMRRLRAGAPKAQVYVSSVPDLKRLWSTGRGNPLGRQIWKLGLCPSMLRDAQDMSEVARQRRATVYERVVAYNEVLKDVCAKDARCRYDGGAVFGYRFTGEQLSKWDWFHPSKDGQGRLAEIAYRKVTAEKYPG
ncbi:SGNH/GDSL hydrolase family protein [Streptomyces corynorhini]|uniref:SGNH/GDSL hydrolase family protein n=1 Tax=Streptomyces corynorhini TaxID=2282652 RepID=UPI001F3BE230|nr:SGNH/GDSL hydrolase family protein [Streptomyces corynorhini]